MIQIHPHLFVGTEQDCLGMDAPKGWTVIHACKSPCHQLKLQYSKALPKDHPSYLLHEDGEDLFCNLVDVPNPDWFAPQIIERAIQKAVDGLNEGREVLIHCNQGQSRSPGIGLLVLQELGAVARELPVALEQFQAVYPPFLPSDGMLGVITRHWKGTPRG